jgi:aminoglycoside phosphotransferase (APT) family kinase protein
MLDFLEPEGGGWVMQGHRTDIELYTGRVERGEVLGEGREAEILAWDGDRVLRLMRSFPDARQRLEREALALTAAAAAGAPVPAVYEQTTLDGRAGLVLERVDGPDLLTLLGARPWMVLWAARTLGQLQGALHRVAAPASLPALKGSILGNAERSELVPAKLVEVARAQLEQLPDGDRLCHGDYHPANVLVGTQGVVAIDWHRATRGDPMGDLARSRVILAAGFVPPKSPWIVRHLDRIGRRVLADGSIRAYCRAAPADLDSVRSWEIVRAIERLAENIEVERPWLLDFIERRRTETA